jgi:SAM-dependent methyltransferase
MKINQVITESHHYEDTAKYAVDTQTGEVVDGPFERYSEIPLRLMGYDGGHKIVSGAVLNGKSEEEDLDEDLPPPEKARDTQIPGTLPTYKKAAAMLDKHGAKGRSIDFGAGLGLGTGELGKDAESYEPFPKEHFKPNYVDVTKVPSNRYHRLVNLNVLNVVPNVGERRDRDNIVRNIGRVLAPGGIAIITTRGKDVLGAKGTAGEEAWSIITSKGTYQKGFSQSELRDYVKGILGDGFDVSSVKLGPAGVMIKKHGKTKKLNELSNDTLGAYKKKVESSVQENKIESHSKDAIEEAINDFSDHIDEHIIKVKGGYELKSKHGNKNLGKYPTKAGAEKRERQVQYFKHKK